MDRMTILVVSYDGYSDVWPGLFASLRRFWPDCPYEIVLANNEKDLANNAVRVIHAGADAQWSTRTRIALEQIETKYVCFLLEDFFFSGKVDAERIESAMDLMEKDGLEYYKLLSFSKIKTKLYDRDDVLQVIPAGLPYGVSLLAAIWEREAFLRMIGDGDYNPWLFEARRIEEAKTAVDKQRLLGVYDPTNPLRICHMIVQGKYLPNAVRTMGAAGIAVDLSSRPVLRGGEYFKYKLKRMGSSLSTRLPFVGDLARKLGFESVSARNLKQSGEGS
ncbi:MAG: hypothetical protein IJK55_06205 [Bacteroidales bacterium]|nr:hypothetical protein [Bacteroidales bacterium]